MSARRWVVTPVKLEPGATYYIEYPGVLNDDELRELQQTLKREGARANVRFLLLEAGAKVERKKQ